jgi:hypothetical protein
MKSDPHTSERQNPRSVKQDDKRPPDKVRDTALTFIKTKAPTTLVRVVRRYR